MAGRDDLVRDAPIVEVEQGVVVDQDVAAAGPVLQLLDLGQEPPVAGEELVEGLPVASTRAWRMNSSRATSGSIDL